MSDEQLRLECLKLAVAMRPSTDQQNLPDMLLRAQQMLDWLKYAPEERRAYVPSGVHL